MLIEIAGFAARYAPGDVGVVCHGRGESDRPLFKENRCAHRAVVQVRNAGDIGVVGEKHVPRPEGLERETLQHGRDEHERRAEMGRRMGEQRERAAVKVAQIAVEQSARSLMFGE